MADLVAGQHPTRLAATLGGHLAPTDRYGDPWTAHSLMDVIEAQGGHLPTSADRPLALFRARLTALPDRYRRPDLVAAEQRAARAAMAARVAADQARIRAERGDQDHAADRHRAGDPRRIRYRVTRWLPRPSDTNGRCVGCDTDQDVTVRPVSIRQVPLCEACAAVVGQDQT